MSTAQESNLTTTTNSSTEVENGSNNDTMMQFLLWSDKFDQTTINTGVCTSRIGNNNGWGNGELQKYSEQNVAIENQQYLSISVSEDTG
jgi:hypothetical protein